MDKPEDLLQLVRRQFLASKHRSAEDCLELGLLMTKLKEATKRGDFMSRIAELGISHETARTLIIAASVFSRPELARLVGAAGSQSKLMALRGLDLADLARLAEGKEVRGLTLGRLKRMSRPALREALRVVDVPDAMFLSTEERRLLGNFRRCDSDARAHVAQAARLLAG